MVCKKCGAQGVEGATFCNQCGARLDSQILCGACGKLNPEGARFCGYCGNRIDGKKTCRCCGAEYEGRFCHVCGTEEAPAKHGNPHVTQTARAAVKKTPAKKKEGSGAWKKIVDLIGGGMGMLAVLCALVFVFFIGVTTRLNGQAMEVAESSMGMAKNPFYFFGAFFEDAAAMKLSKTNAFPNPSMGFTVYAYGITGLVLSVLSIVLVVTFASVAITVYVRGLMGKTERSSHTWVALTVISFLLGAGAFSVLHNMYMNVNMLTLELVETTVGLNGATVAGIVLCSVFLGLSVLCKLVVKGREILNARNIVNLIFGFVGIAFTAVIFGLTENVGLGLKGTADFSTYSGSVKISGSFFLIFSMLLSGESFGGATEIFNNANPFIDEVEKMAIFGNIAQILSVILIVVLAFLLAQRLGKVCKGEKGSCLGLSVTVFVLALAAMIMALLSVGSLKEAFVMWDEELLGESVVKFSASSSIAAFVIATLNLLLSIAQIVVSKILKGNDGEWEEQAAEVWKAPEVPFTVAPVTEAPVTTAPTQEENFRE